MALGPSSRLDFEAASELGGTIRKFKRNLHKQVIQSYLYALVFSQLDHLSSSSRVFARASTQSAVEHEAQESGRASKKLFPTLDEVLREVDPRLSLAVELKYPVQMKVR